MTRAAAEVGSTTYEVLAKLAQGGMAEIFLARALSMAGVSRYVVLKRILRDRANDAQLVRMFLDEARLAAQLQHPNVAHVHDVGRLGDSYFFTMEYVHGETVRAVLQRSAALRTRIPLGCALTIITGAAAGLHHAHERTGDDGRPLGIVHRDVSPSNLMISFEGNVKVVDFGVAKAENRVQETRTGAVKGKIGYLSPEQCQGHPMDRRSDLFSLGIVFWELLALERLYRRDSDFANMTAIVHEPAPPPSSRRPEIPPEIDAVVARLLAKSPGDRYATADELMHDVEEIAVRTGSLLTPSHLARFMREMFGKRPEPWLELHAQEVAAEPITVTSEPVSAELSPAGSSFDRRLHAVRDLSAHQMSSWSPGPVPMHHAPSMPLAPPLAALPPAAIAPSNIATSTIRDSPWRLRLIGMAIGGVLGAILIVLAFTGDSRSGDRAPAVVATVEVDAASVTPQVVDAAVIEPPVDTAGDPREAVAVDANMAPPIDAGEVADDPPRRPERPRPERPRPERPARPARPARPEQPKTESVATLFQQGRFSEVVTACTKTQPAGESTLQCTVAACATADVASARRWFLASPTARRRELAAKCKVVGHDLCASDPMLCQF